MSELSLLIASVNSSSSLTRDVDLGILIERLGNIEYSAILKASKNDIEFVLLIDLKKECLLQIQNSNIRRLVDLLSTTLLIKSTLINPTILFTRTWFSLYVRMQEELLDEDTLPFVIENIVNLESLLSWALKGWAAELETLRHEIHRSPDYKAFALFETARIVNMFEELQTNNPDLFSVDIKKGLKGFKKTMDELLPSCSTDTTFYMHGHSLFEV